MSFRDLVSVETTSHIISTLTKALFVVLAICGFAAAADEGATKTKENSETPARLSDSEIESLTLDGDRLADQGDYLNALRKYTKAYMGVVSEIRGQAFERNVEPKMFTRKELGQEMLEQMEKEYTADELKLMDASYKVLGMMNPELNAAQLMTDLLTEEVAGFYDPDNKRMVLIVEHDQKKSNPGWLGKLLGAKPTFDKEEQKTTLAHELTHALQDQLYDLNAMQEKIEDDDDMLLAFSALVEGDATLLMFAEAGDSDIRTMDPDAMRTTFNLMSWMMPLAGGETYRKCPPIMRESLTFPYLQGMLFALSMASDGWPSIHQAYTKPPLSTEQVLHPEKYRDPEQFDAPQEVQLPRLSKQIKAWKELGGNCLGELQTSIMLKKVRGGTRAAIGWDGDRYEVFEGPDGKLAVVHVSVWDTKEDAKEFIDAYLAMRDVNPFETQQVFAADSQRFADQVGDRVYIVEGFDEPTTKKLARRLKNKTKFVEKTL